jgi:hypothetical protein
LLIQIGTDSKLKFPYQAEDIYRNHETLNYLDKTIEVQIWHPLPLPLTGLVRVWLVNDSLMVVEVKSELLY